MTQNSINSGKLADSNEVIFGVDSRVLVTPSTLNISNDLLRNRVCGGWDNLGFTVTGTQLKIVSSSGVALATNNPATINVPSNVVAGNVVKLKLTAQKELVFANLLNSTFGTNLGVAWASPMPLYIYAIGDASDANMQFAISRVPHLTTSPAAGSMGTSGTACTAEQGMFLFSGATIATYASKACVCIGSVQATKNASDQWTILAMGNSDGLGKFNEATSFTFPSGQKGALAGNYILSNGGTAPTFSAQAYTYSISRWGMYSARVFLTNAAGGTAGAGAVNALLTTPLVLQNTDVCMAYINNNASDLMSSVVPAGSSMQFRDSTVYGGLVKNLFFSTAIRTISLNINCKLP